jgi:tetratricopeptide (TPR) repeat protein
MMDSTTARTAGCARDNEREPLGIPAKMNHGALTKVALLWDYYRHSKVRARMETARNFRSIWKQAAGAIALAWLVCVPISAFAQTEGADAQVEDPPSDVIERVDLLKKQVKATPQDAKARFQLGKALLAAGNKKDAGTQFLEATTLEPKLYVAYHQLTLCKPSNDELDEAIERLNRLQDQHPEELMLRVALSEVLEQRGDCYAAGRSLIDYTYKYKVAPGLLPKIQARIHFLLSQTKDGNSAQTAKTSDAGLEPLAAPSPEMQARRNFAASKTKDAQVPGFAHSNVLP